MRRALLPALSLSFALVATGLLAPAPAPAASGDAALARRLCATVDEELLQRIARGTRPDRSGQIQMLPIEPNFVDGGLTHAGPWDYVQDVPMFWYGPGFIRPGRYTKPVTLADIAPTQAALLEFPDFHAVDGTALPEILSDRGAKPAPRLVVTMVWDSAGTDVLETWPKSWPYLKSLIPKGAWFEHASAGASPSNTPVSHATIGSGAFPFHHGFTDEVIFANGKLQKPNENGPGFLLEPTFADVYDAGMENEPVVGVVATLSAHVGMMSHGLMWGGGDKDLAITREKEDAETGGAESVTWGMTTDMAPFYRLPKYANQVGTIDPFNEEIDVRDGQRDGNWRQNSIRQLNNGFDTPARTPYQTQLIEELVRRERFGRDDVPDLLYLNYKAIDTIGHRFSADGIEMSDAVEVQDEDLEGFMDFLNDEVGKRKWVMLVTADHGTNRDPAVSGAFQIGIDELEADIAEAFDDGDNTPLVLRLRPTQVWLDEAELKQGGHTIEEVAEFIGNLTQAETVKPTLEPAPDPGAKVFEAVFASSILGSLPCLPDVGEF